MRKGGSIEICPKFSILKVMGGQEMPTYKVADPTLHLDHLLYEVMVTGNPHRDIPFDIVNGFSDWGHGFYHELHRVFDREWWLGMDITFPPALVVQTPQGTPHWTRRPENGKEDLYHFIFCLRMTMVYLAKHPIGDASPLTTSELAAMLPKLPRRAAFVRSGEDVGVVYTTDTAKPVSGAEFTNRLQAIQTQTHEKYCKPKAEVEAGFFKASEKTETKTEPEIDSDTPPQRWEEL
jgi:hypothetical protein